MLSPVQRAILAAVQASIGSGSTTAGLPAGPVSFLFTDIEASAVRWEKRPDAMREALAQHDALLGQVVTDNAGVVFKHTGDGMGASFADPADACLLYTSPSPRDRG